MSERRRRVHIAEVGITWPPETFVRWKLEGLVARGFDVTVAAFMPRGDSGVRLPGVRIVPLPPWDEPDSRTLARAAAGVLALAVRSPRSLAAAIAAARHPIRERRAGRVIAFARRMRTYLPLARLRPDVVHFEWNSAAVSYLPLERAWGCPTAVSCHGTDVNVRPHTSQGETWARWLRTSFERVTAVHCVSRALVAEATALGMDPARAWLIPPAVDPAYFAPGDSDAPGGAELRIVSVGQMRWVKGHEYALRAVRALLDMGVPTRLELVGDEPREAVGEEGERPRIEAAIARLGLADHVRLCGELDSAGVRSRLREADVLLHTSLSEGIPLAILEAMSCGLPVVATDCGGIREAVTHGVDGYVVPMRATDAAADALRELHEDSARRRTMGAAGRARVEAEFTLEAQLDAFAFHYERLAAGAPVGLDPSAVAQRPRPGRRTSPDGPRLRLLSVAPLHWSAGHDDAMEAVARLRSQGVDCRLRIAGDGPYRDVLLFVRRQLGLEDAVELADAAGDDAARWADVWVDASLGAGAGPGPGSREAAARGLPVVATSAEAGAGEGAPTLVPAGDPAALATALAALAREPAAV